MRKSFNGWNSEELTFSYKTYYFPKTTTPPPINTNLAGGSLNFSTRKLDCYQQVFYRLVRFKRNNARAYGQAIGRIKLRLDFITNSSMTVYASHKEALEKILVYL